MGVGEGGVGEREESQAIRTMGSFVRGAAAGDGIPAAGQLSRKHNSEQL